MTVLTGEALDLCFTLKENWEPKAGPDGHPGMQSAVAGGLIEEQTAVEVAELTLAVAHSQVQHRGVNAASLQAPVERGEYLLFEIKHSVEFLFDDGVDDDLDAEFDRMSESHSDTSTHDALALSLEGFAVYANRHRERLATLPDFDVATIDEAFTVAQRLREQSAIKLSNPKKDEQQRQLELRNSLITLLHERMTKVRRAARYVFRHHPNLARKFTSTYERVQRARRRSRQAAASNGATATQEVNP